jgi:hypothetical protein
MYVSNIYSACIVCLNGRLARLNTKRYTMILRFYLIICLACLISRLTYLMDRLARIMTQR